MPDMRTRRLPLYKKIWAMHTKTFLQVKKTKVQAQKYQEHFGMYDCFVVSISPLI